MAHVDILLYRLSCACRRSFHNCLACESAKFLDTSSLKETEALQIVMRFQQSGVVSGLEEDTDAIKFDHVSYLLPTKFLFSFYFILLDIGWIGMKRKRCEGNRLKRKIPSPCDELARFPFFTSSSSRKFSAAHIFANFAIIKSISTPKNIAKV